MGEVAVLCGEELNEEEVEGYLAFLKQVTAVALRRLIEREDWELTVSLVGEEQMRLPINTATVSLGCLPFWLCTAFYTFWAVITKTTSSGK